MAKKKKEQPVEQEETTSLAVNDAWTGMLVISFLTLSVGTGLLAWDWYQYSDQEAPKGQLKYNTAPPGGIKKEEPKKEEPKKEEPKKEEPKKEEPKKEEKGEEKKEEKKKEEEKKEVRLHVPMRPWIAHRDIAHRDEEENVRPRNPVRIETSEFILENDPRNRNLLRPFRQPREGLFSGISA